MIGVGVISFNRPNYLKKVIASLKRQSIKAEYYLFQDGVRNRFSRKLTTPSELVQQSIKLFNLGPVLAEKDNIGNAHNQLRAIDYMAQRYENFLILEDDAVLGKDYLKVCSILYNQFKHKDLFSVNGGFRRVGSHAGKAFYTNTQDSPSTHWFGEFYNAQQWNELRPFYMQYFDLVKSVDYRFRDSNKIRKLFHSNGFMIPQSSQDAGRDFALYLAKKKRLTLEVNRGFYIGEVGLHFTSATYKRYNFSTSKPYEFKEDMLRTSFYV
jgi:hypothetical protein